MIKSNEGGFEVQNLELLNQDSLGLNSILIPKGPDCVFWLYSDFGQVPMTRNFHILG